MITKTAEEQHEKSDFRVTELFSSYAQAELPSSLVITGKWDSTEGVTLGPGDSHSVSLSSEEDHLGPLAQPLKQKRSSTRADNLLQVDPAGLQTHVTGVSFSVSII